MELVSALAVVAAFAECSRYVYSWKYYTQLSNGRLGTHSLPKHLAVPRNSLDWRHRRAAGGQEDRMYSGNMLCIASARLEVALDKQWKFPSQHIKHNPLLMRNLSDTKGK
jgi:hypothetical protein